MGSLEVVSKETFQQQLEGMSSCASCQKERLKEVANRKLSRRNRKGTHVKSNSPIVVRLRDTIKVSMRGRMKDAGLSSDQESDMSSDESSSPSPASTASSQHSSTSSTPPESPRERNPRKTVRPSQSRIRRSRKDGKNFNAFLSAIEKVHSKDQGFHLINNLNQYNWHSKEYKNLAGLDFSAHGPAGDLLLNNAVAAAAYHNSITNTFLRGMATGSSPTPDHMAPPTYSHICSKPPKTFHSFAKKNVDVICNDLTSDSQASGELSMEDGDSAENGSEVSCSDTQSESDVSLAGDVGGGELSREELEKLKEFTLGCPLTRYTCPPHQCPECLEAYYAYTHYYAQDSDILKVEILNPGVEDPSSTTSSTTKEQASGPNNLQSGSPTVEVTPPPFPNSQDSDSSRNELSATDSVSEDSPGTKCSRTKTAVVSVAAFFSKRSRKSSKPTMGSHCYPDTVTVDITDSDVTFSVSYPSFSVDEVNGDSDPESTQGGCGMLPNQGWVNSYYDFYHNFYATMLGFMPFLIPAYWVPPYYPSAYPTMTIPRPFHVDKPAKCLSSHQATQTSEEYRPFPPVQPPQRPWIPITHPDPNKPVAIYTVMCYNVLCDKYATRQLYGYCPSWALNWEYRKKIILDEIRQYSADIISLQEVETEQFYNYFLPELKTNGYDGVFSPKSRARTMSESERKHVDGCAIFYQTSKFNLLKERLVEFNQLAISTAEGSHEMINRVMTKDNIGLAALLETKEAVWENGLPPEGHVKQPILVATCHVHWDPEYSDVKLIQTMMLMSELKNIIQDTQTSLRPGSSAPDSNSVPLILCGDLNSLPDSGVVDFLNVGRVSAQHEDFKDLGYEDCLRKLSVSDNKDIYTHGFRLSQAYNKDVMPYTNYTYDFKGIIDYIFYSRDYMHPLGLLGPLDQEWFRENKVFGCPHPQIPSDHLPLLVEFEMTSPASGKIGSNSNSGSSANDSRRGNSSQGLVRR